MLMIETGKRLYVDGVKVNNPESFNVYDTGYCKISMHRCESDIFIITPHGESIEQYILSFVNSIDAELQRIQTPISKFTTQGSTFAHNEIHAKNACASMSTSNHLFIQRRVFMFDTTQQRQSSFTWRIRTHFPEFNDGILNDNDWIRHQNGIIVDLTSPYTIMRQIKSHKTVNILQEMGVVCETVIHFVAQNGLFIPTTINNRSCPMYGPTIYNPVINNPTLRTVDLKSMEFVDMKNDPDELCQCCGEQLVNPYAYGINVDNDNVIGICTLCVFTSNETFICSSQYCIHRINCKRNMKDICRSQYKVSFEQMIRIQKTLNDISREALRIHDNIVVIKQFETLSCIDVASLIHAVRNGTVDIVAVI
jgi:hypothetical protein